ncbi:hypothetical protein N7466_007708 [Penicillium verhagenii]|uniref:uncharacterized protein n=1 Tax=Penicillium verhagenii TaxID=1562060 RepID=UPI0025458A69|nr:uncharacterized protein N7466_007708 [Penicillium verhagenii]KAJ5928752.1 hypothetical protein N7466_007708 [Penicillium verhagenii]
MSRPETSTSTSTTAQNGTSGTAPLTQANVNQVPRASRSSVERFARAPASEGPYFIGAVSADRASHLALANQGNAK